MSGSLSRQAALRVAAAGSLVAPLLLAPVAGATCRSYRPRQSKGPGGCRPNPWPTAAERYLPRFS